jgi:hypothetical protein
MAVPFFVWSGEPPYENNLRRLVPFESCKTTYQVRVWFTFDPRPRVFVTTSWIIQSAVFLVERIEASNTNNFVISVSMLANKLAVTDDWQVRESRKVSAGTRHVRHFVRWRPTTKQSRNWNLFRHSMREPKTPEADCNDGNNNEEIFWECSHYVGLDATNKRVVPSHAAVFGGTILTVDNSAPMRASKCADNRITQRSTSAARQASRKLIERRQVPVWHWSYRRAHDKREPVVSG